MVNIALKMAAVPKNYAAILNFKSFFFFILRNK